MADGFLGRWSRRKLDIRDGKALAPEPPAPAAPALAPQQASPGSAALRPPTQEPDGETTARQPRAPTAPAHDRNEPPPPPTLEDVKLLTRESDYSMFARRGVDPQVSNAAMKKLFSDPHYNIMDGLDIYIDDYSKPDPIPPAMLRQLVSAQFLDLFGEEKKAREAQEALEREKLAQTATSDPNAPATREVADDPTPQTMAQSGAPNPGAPASDRPLPDHADPDLRLQQDHASPGKIPGDGAA